MRRALEGLDGVAAVRAHGDAFDLVRVPGGPDRAVLEARVAALVVLPGLRRRLARSRAGGARERAGGDDCQGGVERVYSR